MVARTRPLAGSIFWMRSSAIWNRCWPSKAVQLVAAGEPHLLTVVGDPVHPIDAGKGPIFTEDFGG
jgi:hypothetical protein